MVRNLESEEWIVLLVQQTSQRREYTVCTILRHSMMVTLREVYETSKLNAQRGYTKAIDMWSVGCVMTALLTGQSYFDDSENSAMKRNSSEALREAAVQCDLQRLDYGHRWKHVSSTAKGLVRKILVRDETERLRVEQALRHQWFTIDVQGADLDERYRHVVMGWTRHYPVVDFEERLETWIDFDLRYREPRRLVSPPCMMSTWNLTTV